MLTDFDKIEARMLGDSFKVFGQPFQIVPMKTRPNKRPVRDHGRDPFELCGVKYETNQLNDLDKNGRIDRAGKRIGGMSFNNMSTKSIRLNVRLCDMPYEPRQFDAVICVRSGKVYEVLDIEATGHSDAYLKLSEVEGPYDKLT
ncbi:hypothetical protein [Sulfitobacter sp. 1A15106]|uniref:hypothetical protein n=1 Tax=Sulfitobacter sp. 1A15106 TaxID=3368590 RepID=UPI003745A13C